MSTLAKRKRRNISMSPWRHRLFDPWNRGLLSPWSENIFSTDFSDLRKSLMKFNDAFKDDFFEDDSLMPAMNVKEHEKDFELEFAAPGFNKKDFEVSIEDDVLHVSAKKEQKETEEEDDFTRKEFSYKSFKRSSTLPESVDLEQDVKASYKNGILNIKLLKKEEAQVEKPAKKVIDID
ncbi:MAG: Hsp20/alpha crystallin family protein [Flavobacteriaceae bacterium]|nr:Hsp20/alpha crystallin family protein [Flavobacteriaceae bacterium]